MRLIACSTDISPCPTTDQVLVTSEATDLFLNGGFDPALFEMVLEYTFGIWIVGLTIGIVIAQIRKMRVR